MTMTDHDLKTLAARGISEAEALEQLNRFKTGFPYLKIIDSATPGSGILRLTPEQQQAAADRWQTFVDDGGQACKFVPASGAASRMFKALFNFVDGGTDTPAPGSDVEQVLENIEKFAFFPALNAVCIHNFGKSVKDLRAEGKNRDIIAAIIGGSGLNYGQLPKGLLQFHKYDGGSRTPLEELAKCSAVFILSDLSFRAYSFPASAMTCANRAATFRWCAAPRLLPLGGT